MRIKLSVPIDIPALPSAVRADMLAPIYCGESILSATNRGRSMPDKQITHISTDSREAKQGDLFISLTRDSLLASRHISEALSKGAYALCNREASGSDLTLIESLASFYRDLLPNLKKVIAITGSTGKTTTKEFTQALISATRKSHATRENMNNEIGLPLTILESPHDTEVLILEMGMNEKGEISRLSRTARPDVGAITNIGTAHIGKLGSRDAIADAKLEIADGISPGGILLTRAEDRLESKRCEEIFEYTYSFRNRNATSVLIPTSVGDYRFKIGKDSLPLPFFTDAPHVLEDLSLSLSIAYHAGMSVQELSDAIGRLGPGLLRYSISRIGRITVIDDAYNSSLESVRAAMALLKDQRCTIRSALLGDILESGDYSKEIHYQLGMIAAETVDKLYLTGNMSDTVKEGALTAGLSESRIFIIQKTDNIRSIAYSVGDFVVDGECLLVKASHGCGLYKFKEEYERLVTKDE